ERQALALEAKAAALRPALDEAAGRVYAQKDRVSQLYARVLRTEGPRLKAALADWGNAKSEFSRLTAGWEAARKEMLGALGQADQARQDAAKGLREAAAAVNGEAKQAAEGLKRFAWIERAGKFVTLLEAAPDVV
ncbi:hypothetical protein D7V80_41240, partial [Corallococcus sp. CA054B]|uniref:hypothetical protein n=1 Tax=Corallococcus sp. CA054B TaxID=2316734 RepID=UPI000ED31BC1